ncbi:MAG: hypothetical protein ACAH80_16545 [Alphaproteobacteria bacterium]
MPLSAQLIKQMKDGSLTTLRLQRQHLDERDYAMLSSYVKTSQTLAELDLSYSGGAFELMADGIKQNRSIVKLGLAQTVQDHNMPTLIDILKENQGITQLNLDNCYFGLSGLWKLAAFVKTRPDITHIDMNGVNVDDRTGKPRMESLERAVKESPNILHFEPGTPELQKHCEANQKTAKDLVEKVAANPDALSAAEVEEVKKRLSSFLHVAENDVKLPKEQVARLLINLEDVAGQNGIAFPMPGRYTEITAGMPKIFRPSATKVDCTKDLTQTQLYAAAEAGQVDEMMASLNKHGRKLTAADCLLKPEGKKETLVELIARQSKLESVMTVFNWTGDPRGLKAAAAAVPAREWQRQLKDKPVDQLIFQANAATFKQPRR